VVLLHGVTRCGRDFEPLVASLTATHEGNAVHGHGPRLAVLDQRGHGDSSRASRYLVTDYAADAARFIDAHGPCVVVGHSLGAMVAAHVAAHLPVLVRGAVLIDPPFHGMGRRIGGSTWEALFVGLRDARRRGGGVPALAAAIAEIRLPAGARTVRLGDVRDAAALSWHAECLSRLDPEVLTPVIEGRWLEGYDPPAVAASTTGFPSCPSTMRGTPCSGHGNCSAASGGCVCEAGWDRDDCSECAPGFAASGAGSCVPSASAPTASAFPL
jgi:pimeloyl-ACP methyl ester carboxylesterase